MFGSLVAVDDCQILLECVIVSSNLMTVVWTTSRMMLAMSELLNCYQVLGISSRNLARIVVYSV